MWFTMAAMDTQKLQFINAAISLAEQGSQTGMGGPFGAVIVRENQIISKGQNQVTSLNDPTAHAETQAIRAACQALQTFQLTGCEIYTSCEPCPMCLSAIYWARLDKIYFAATREDAARIGFDDAFIYQELQTALAQRQIPIEQLAVPTTLAPLLAWQANPNKIHY